MKRPSNILLIGPLSEADDRVRELGMNLMTSFMMMESMERLEAAEQEYKSAQEVEDPETVREKEMQLKACKHTVQIAAALLEAEEEVSQ